MTGQRGKQVPGKSPFSAQGDKFQEGREVDGPRAMWPGDRLAALFDVAGAKNARGIR